MAAATMCGDTCAALATDRKNCGGCNQACGPGAACTSGKCVCAPGTTACGSSCFDVTSDHESCGGCGIACAAGQICVNGACVAEENSWDMLGHDVRHSGWNAVETAVPSGDHPADLWSITLTFAPLRSPAVMGGRVFVTSQSWTKSNPLWAVHAADGTAAWSHDFGDVFSVGQPSASGDAVFVQECNNDPGTNLWAFDAAAGTVRWSTPFDAQWETFWSPAVASSSVFIDGGEYGGLIGFDATTGARLFSVGLEQYDEWSPSFWSGAVFSFVGGNFRAHDPLSGDELWRVTVPWRSTNYDMGTVPTFSGSTAYVVAPPAVAAVDLTSRTIAWTIPDAKASGTPAFADGVLYVVAGGALQARDPSNGAVEWTFAGDSKLSYPPVIAAGFVYVASDAHVYALATSGHASVWSLDGGGWLAVAEGRLFVAGTNGTLAGYKLD